MKQTKEGKPGIRNPRFFPAKQRSYPDSLRYREARKKAGWIMLLCVTLLPLGCASLGNSAWVKKQAANGLYPTFKDFHDVALRCDDLQILKTTMESYVLLVDTLIEESPKNQHIIVLASSLYAYYSFGFVVHEDLERARKLYWKGINIGKRALKLNPALKKALEQGEPLYKNVDLLRPKKDLEAAFCTALNQGMLLICSLDQPDAFGEANDFKALTEWIIDLDEGYFYGAAHSLMGAYYGIMPAMMGGGPEKAQKAFLKAIEINPNLLLHYYLYARYVPTLIDDEALFDELIGKIMDKPSDADPRVAGLNEVAKVKARLLEEDRDLYFF